MTLTISGHMMGRFASAHLTGPCAARSLTVMGITPFGGAEDQFSLEIYHSHGDMHIWRILDTDGDVIKGGLVPDGRSYDGLGAGRHHILFKGGFILDLTGFDENTKTYSHEAVAIDKDAPATAPDLASDPMCFAAGSVVRCADGLRPIETICAGDMMWTADQGYQPMQWVAETHVDLSERPDLAPVEILRGGHCVEIARAPCFGLA